MTVRGVRSQCGVDVRKPIKRTVITAAAAARQFPLTAPRSERGIAYFRVPLGALRVRVTRANFLPPPADAFISPSLTFTSLISWETKGGMRLRSAWLACILPWSALAIKSSEAGIVDWHKPFIGDVLTGNPGLTPVFHRIEEENGNTRSLVLAATASNVLAALHPENGTIGARRTTLMFLKITNAK